MLPIYLARLALPFFANIGDACKLPAHNLFFLPPWWEYIPTQINDIGDCAPHVVLPDGLWLVGLAVIDILLRIVAFLALISIFIASVEYIIAIGNPEKITNARKRIINALVGIAIAFVAVAIVTFAGKALGS